MVKTNKRLRQQSIGITNDALIELAQNDIVNTNDDALFQIDTVGSAVTTKPRKYTTTSTDTTTHTTPRTTTTKRTTKRKQPSVPSVHAKPANNKQQPSSGEQLYDAWSQPLPDVQPHTDQYGFIDTPVIKPIVHHRTATQRAQAARGTTRSVLVHTINSGTSYNPHEQKRQQLLEYTNTVLHRQNKHIDRLEQKKAYDTTAYERDDTSQSEDDGWMDEGDDGASGGGQVQKRSKKPKTSQQKRRQAEHRQRLRVAEELVRRKQFNASLMQLPFIAGELTGEQAEKLRLKQEMKQLKDQLEQHPRLGKRFIEPVLPDVALSEELDGARSMRRVKPVLGGVRQLLQAHEQRHVIEVYRRRDDKKWKSKKARNKYQMKNRKLDVMPAGMAEQ